ncbi:MAG: ABC-three component system protein [Solidesulfovibrio sp.]
MATKQVKQSAFGTGINQANRDVYANCNFVDTGPKSGLRQTLEMLQGKIASEPGAGRFIEELSDYMRPRTEREITGLEKKLKDGNREAQVSDAEFLKLKFIKKLVKDELSESVQKAYANILAYINTIFAMKIAPEIQNGESHKHIDAQIYQEIIYPIYQDVSIADIGISPDHIRGMLYYLTGNCYIKWV